MFLKKYIVQRDILKNIVVYSRSHGEILLVQGRVYSV